jgi:microcystin degradation protein MlrC
MYRELPYDDVAPEVRRARALAAAALRGAGAALDAMARRLALVEAPAASGDAEPHLEFHACHAEAGAPEGALYVNGLMVGRRADVNRL